MTNILIEELKNHPKVIEAMIETLKSFIEKDDVEPYYKIGEFYYFWDKIEKGYIYAKLIELDFDDSDLPFAVKLPSDDIKKWWFKYAGKELPKN